MEAIEASDGFKPGYVPGFVPAAEADAMLAALRGELEWFSVQARRREYFMARDEVDYNYLEGKAADGFSYRSREFHPAVEGLVANINGSLGSRLDLCFLNMYEDQFDSLGWHADDHMLIDQTDPIAVVSLGAEREIWWKEKSAKGAVPPENRQLLGHGSLFVMPAGFQALMYHRIPKHDRPCGPRISLTFRTLLR